MLNSGRLLGDVTVLLALDQRVVVLVGELLLEHLLDFLDQLAEGDGDPLVALGLGLLQRGLERLALVLVEAHAAGELLRADDDALDAGGDFERIVLHVFAGAAENRVQQLLFRRQLGLRLRRDLADQHVAGPHVGADADDAGFVEVAELPLADVGDVAGELLAAELRLADFDVELLDVDRGVGVARHQFFADDDGVLEVEAVPGHEGRQDVSAQGELAVARGGAVGDHLALLDLVAHLHDRLLVLAGSLVEAHELAELVDVAADFDVFGVDLGHHALALGADQHARVQGGLLLQARSPPTAAR